METFVIINNIICSKKVLSDSDISSSKYRSIIGSKKYVIFDLHLFVNKHIKFLFNLNKDNNI